MNTSATWFGRYATAVQGPSGHNIRVSASSGNPAGRPTGSRNQSTVFFQELLNGQGEALIQKGIELSLKGDTRALSICWDRLLPARKERTIELPLPSVTDAKSASVALASVVTAVAEGSITPGEAESLARVL